MDNRDYEKALDKCWNKFCESKPTLSKQAGVLTLFNFIFNYLYPIDKHNLTSDAEGEDEMLCVSRKQIDALQGEIFKAIMDAHDADDWQDAAHYILDVMPRSFAALFGSKCLPDELPEDNFAKSEPKPAEPKLKRCDKVITPSGEVRIIEETHFENGNWLYLVRDPDQWVSESDLEPYTEPTDFGREVNIPTEKQSRNYSQNIANCIKEFDNILKGSFSKERRLNIAAMAMQGILSNADRMKQYGEIAMRESDNLTQLVARNAMRYADALIAEAEKGGAQ